MRRKMEYNTTCPYCNKRATCNDEFTVTRRKTTQYFHKACYEANSRRAKTIQGGI